MSVIGASLQISFQICQSAVCVFYRRKMMNLRKNSIFYRSMSQQTLKFYLPSPSTEQATSYAAVAARQHDAPNLPERIIQSEVPFTPVRNGAWQINKKSFLPISTYNSFKRRRREPWDENHRRFYCERPANGILWEESIQQEEVVYVRLTFGWHHSSLWRGNQSGRH